jgi:hypothetical protein
VTAKVVVVVEDQDASFGAGALAEKMSRGEPADASTYNDKVVGFAGALLRARGIPLLAIAQTMGGSETAIVIAPHAGQRGRVIVGRFFRGVLGGSERSQKRLVDRRAANSQRGTIQEISARNRAMQPEFAISLFLAHVAIDVNVLALS